MADDLSSDRRPPDPSPISLLERRRIEAEIVIPLIDAMAARFGREDVLSVLRDVIDGLARESGARLAAHGPGPTAAPTSDASGASGVARAPDLLDFAHVIQAWWANDALRADLKRSERDRLEFDVVRCRYAEMYRELGRPDLGRILSCRRDHALIDGYAPQYELERTQTLLEGAPCCDFRFRKRSASSPEDTSSSGADAGEAGPGTTTPADAPGGTRSDEGGRT